MKPGARGAIDVGTGPRSAGDERTRVRVVDYLASPGGGVRFLSEMVGALSARRDLEFEYVSHGAALERLRAILPDVSFRDVPPANRWRTEIVMRGVPGATLLNRLLKTPDFHFDVPASVFDGCDVVWLPWASRHRVPAQCAHRVVGTLHDVILLEVDGVTAPSNRADERETIARWVASAATLAVDARTTVATLTRLLGAPPGRAQVIPLSARHRRPPPSPPRPAWTFAERPFILCSANCSPHKNLETLLRGVGAWGAKVPLVLTGAGTDLWAGSEPVRRRLRDVAIDAGLEPGRNLFPLDYVPDADYYALLERAWAVVIPTLAEGAGLPVLEAIEQGVPVVASDIPVAREMVEGAGAAVTWFDPRSSASLAAQLEALRASYDAHRAAAVAQVERLRLRTWADVAHQYAELLVARREAPRAGRRTTP